VGNLFFNNGELSERRRGKWFLPNQSLMGWKRGGEKNERNSVLMGER
jgi:hypothetical protein